MTKRKTLSCIFIAIGTALLLFAVGLTGYNIYAQKRAEKNSLNALNKLEQSIVKSDEEFLYKKYPDMEMPIKKIDGIEYIGILEIDEINVKLPVANEWSYENLKKMPCRYHGSAYKNNMVIAAHNYSSHFGSLSSVSAGSKITFTDTEGRSFIYKVLGSEIIQPSDIDKMINENCDLTLFTCTPSGRTRLTVRCELEK